MDDALDTVGVTSAYEFFTGKDWYTGEELGLWNRTGGAIIDLVIAKKAKKIGKGLGYLDKKILGGRGTKLVNEGYQFGKKKLDDATSAVKKKLCNCKLDNQIREDKLSKSEGKGYGSPTEKSMRRKKEKLEREREHQQNKGRKQARKEAQSAKWKSANYVTGDMPHDGRKAKHVPAGKQLDEKGYKKYTEDGKPALYHPKLSDPSGNYKKLQNFEKKAWEEGFEVETTGKGVRYKIVKYTKPVGAGNGKDAKYVRIELSGGSMHGHPITEEEFKDHYKGKFLDPKINKNGLPEMDPGF